MVNSTSQRIADRYDLHEIIGQGGMASVYRGVDIQTGDSVAIKHLKHELATPDMIERFRREGEALRELNHPNIVKMLDAVQEGEAHYLIMELIEGGSLRSVLDANPRVPVPQMLLVALDVCDALTRSHRLDIIHRDIKPANVLVVNDGTPRLTDFGIAQSRGSDMTDSNVIMGTFAYLSPEMLQNEPASKLSDIWALGVLFFEMIAGERPFQGDQAASIITSILSHAVPDLEATRPDVPVALVDLIYRMLIKKPSERIPSVRLVGAELEAIMQGRVAGSQAQSLSPIISLRNDEPIPNLGKRFATPTPQDIRKKHNLPAQVTPFVGRSHELEALAEQIANPDLRLITLMAPGGMGKTRLALEAAGHHLDKFENGVYFVDLAPVESAENIVVAIAEAVNYPFQQDGRSREDQILDYFREKEQLIIMDNFEHVLEGATLVTDILQAAPGIQIIVTSRHKLNQMGEHIFSLQGLQQAHDAQQESEAVQLFMQSARRVQADFEVNDENRASVEQICALVDGLPLGILLAASWLAMLNPVEIVTEIQQGIDTLEAEMTDLPERHRSIRAVFDYSHRLLSDADKEAFYQLSVFRGGFTREAAMAVAGASLRTLMSLLNKSLIQRNQRTGRYAIHELLRQYGEEYLVSSDSRDATQDAHAEYFMQFLADREVDIKGRRQLEGLNEIQSELGNIRIAWDWALSEKRHDWIDLALESLKLFCELRGRIQDHIEFMGSVRHGVSEEIDGKPNLIWYRAVMREYPLLRHKPDEFETYKACLAVASEADNSEEMAHGYLTLGDVSVTRRDLKSAIDYYQKSVAVFETLDDKFYVARILNRLGLCFGFMQQADVYTDYGQRSYELARQIGNEIDAAWALHSLATANAMKGDLVAARLNYRTAKPIWTRMQHLNGLAMSLSIVAFTHAVVQDSGVEVVESANLAIQIATDMNDPIPLGYAHGALGSYSLVLGNYDEAIRLATRGQEFVRHHPTGIISVTSVATLAHALADNLDIARANLIAGLQPAVSIGSKGHALLYLGAASILMNANGAFERATTLLSLYITGLGFETVLTWKGFTDLTSKLKSELGEATFDVAWEKAKTLDVLETGRQLLEELGADS